MKPFTNKRHGRRGAALVEFALVLPLFFAVVLGIIEFGRAMMVAQIVTNSAREATRLAIIDGATNSSVTTWVGDFLGDSINVDPNSVTVTINIVAAPGNTDPFNQIGNAQAKDIITINVEVPFDDVSYIPGSYLSGKNLSAKSAMRHE